MKALAQPTSYSLRVWVDTVYRRRCYKKIFYMVTSMDFDFISAVQNLPRLSIMATAAGLVPNLKPAPQVWVTC
eukprot:6210598-Pleurochrysis_carterae.AAC.1